MIDRRTFIALGTTSLAGIMLPAVSGRDFAFRLPFSPDAAFADEDESFEVLVLSRTMFAVVLADVSNGNAPVANAQVTLKSRYASGKTLTATTDGRGTAIFEIAELSEGYVGPSTQLDSYDFNGGISVSAAGYRDVEIPLARIQGGTAVCAPTRPLSDGLPYFRQLTFDEWDIQYSTGTFLMPPDDDLSANVAPDTHAITVEAHLPQGGEATLAVSKVIPAEGDLPEQVTQIAQAHAVADASSNRAVFSFEDYFLDQASGLLEEGCSLRFTLTYQDVTYHLDSAMAVAVSPIANAESGSATIVPSTTDSEVAPFDFPEAFPVLGGSKFTCWMPELPVLFNFSFMGYVLFGVGTAPISYRNDQGVFDQDYWKKSPRESGAEQARKHVSDLKGKYESYRDMSAGAGTDPKHSKLLQHKCSKNFSFDIALQTYGTLAYDWVNEKWAGDGDPAKASFNALFQVKTDLIWTQQITLGPVPFFITINPWVLTKLAFGFGAMTHGRGTDFFKNLSFDFSHTSASFAIQFGFALSAGLGIAGVVAIGLRGAVALTLFISYEHAEGKQLPRLRVGASVSVDAFMQALLFKWSSKIWWGNWPALLDSWKMSTDLSADDTPMRRSEFALSGDNPYTLDAVVGSIAGANADALSNLVDAATIVTNSELLDRAEVAATATDAAPLVRDWSQVVTRFVSDPDPESLDEGPVEHYVHQMVSVENDAPLFEYRYIGHATGASIDETAHAQGVSNSDRGGLFPSVDEVLYEGVLSETRMKMVSVNGIPCLFRIASVAYGGEARSRLVVHTKTEGVWSNPQVIDFSFGFGKGDIERTDSYDYDFDVVDFTYKSGVQRAYVLLMSGDRPSGDDTGFAVASTSGVLSVLSLEVSGDGVSVRYHTSWRSISGGKAKDEGYHCLQCPRITIGKSIVEGRVTGAYLHRQAKTAEEAIGDAATVWLECFTVWGNVSSESLCFSQVHRFSAAPTNIEIGAPEKQGSWMVVPVAYECASGCGVFSYADGIDGIAGWGYTPPNGSLRHLEPWRAHRGFLAAKDDRLQHITWTRGSGLAIEPVGAADCAPSMFGVSANGSCILYAENTDGQVGQEFDYKDNPMPIDGTCFRIFASTLVGGLFTEPFVLCELDHAVDQIATATAASGMLSCLSSRIVNGDTSEADLYGIEVPMVACATPMGAVPMSGAVVPGSSSEDFMVSLRNDGNTLLSAGVIDLYREGSDQPFSSAEIGFGSSNRMASVHDPELDDGEESSASSSLKYALEVIGESFANHPLVADNENAVLAPGKTAQFRASFSIPASWENDAGTYVKLYAKARDLVAIDPVTLEEIRPGANTEDGSMLDEYHIPDADCERSEVMIGMSMQAAAERLRDAPMTVQHGESDPGEREPGGSSAAKRSSLASTGDGLGFAGPAAMAAAAAGAALVGYSARRCALEDEGREGEDDELR